MVSKLSELTAKSLTCPGTPNDDADTLSQAKTRVPPEYVTHVTVAAWPGARMEVPDEVVTPPPNVMLPALTLSRSQVKPFPILVGAEVTVTG
jgi:hypothetical protein